MARRLWLYVAEKFVVSVQWLRSSPVRQEWLVNPGVLQEACQEGDERIRDCSYKRADLPRARALVCKPAVLTQAISWLLHSETHCQ